MQIIESLLTSRLSQSLILIGVACFIVAIIKQIPTWNIQLDRTQVVAFRVLGCFLFVLAFAFAWFAPPKSDEKGLTTIINIPPRSTANIEPTTTTTPTITIITTSTPPDSTKTPSVAKPTETMSPTNTLTPIAIPATATIETDVTTGYRITHSVITSGGNLRNGPSYRVGDTIGESTASGSSPLTSSSYILNSGFWTNMTDTVPLINPTEGDSN